MRFVHTSDWQIGKTFRFADDASQLLRDERLEAVTRLGELARREDATAILVAGDVYDVETPTERTLRQPIERMRAFPDIEWHLIPGNHDAHTPRGPWERLLRLIASEHVPENIHLHLAPEPVAIAGGAAWLLPAILTRRHAAADPTDAMGTARTPEGAIRIGLAHGSIRSFGTDESSTNNLIAIDRPERAGLTYLALGDWHGAQGIGERCWYSGTPEIDDFSTGGRGGGGALVVDLDGARAVPVVTCHRVGRFSWQRLEMALHNATDVDVLDARLRNLSSDLGAVLVWLTVTGALSLAERDAFENKIQYSVGSALRVLRLDDAGLVPRPTSADLETIDHSGFVRTAADQLAARAADPNDPEQDIAAAALQRLYLLHMRTIGSAAQ
jgi:DNA repair exonuclease SbcCD nuclease subunit